MIPILCIDTRPNIAEMNENRMLSNYQPLFTDDWHHPINLQWNRQFESYFDDRFGFRSYLVNIQKTLMTRFNSIVDVPNVGFCQKKIVGVSAGLMMNWEAFYTETILL